LICDALPLGHFGTPGKKFLEKQLTPGGILLNLRVWTETGNENQFLRVPHRSLPPLSRRFLSTKLRHNPGRHSGGDGEINGIQLNIVQQASMEFSEFAHLSPLHEWRKIYESAFEQLRYNRFHMRFTVSG